MSAWIVSRAHIDVLVQALTAEAGLAGRGKILMDAETGEFSRAELSPDEIGRELWRENLRSVIFYRYPRDTDGDRPGPLDFKDSDVDTYTYREPARVMSDAEVCKAASCFDYQSCEHPGWETSRANKWIETLMSRHHVAAIPDDVPWGFDEEDVHGGPANADLWK